MSKQTLAKLRAVKGKEHTKVKEDQIIQNVNTLLLGAHDEEKAALAVLGLDHQIKYERQLTEDFRRTKHAETIYSTEAFTGKQIMALCHNFMLKLLPSEEYNGSIPADLGRVVKSFEDKNKIDNTNRGHYYILAPTEQFKNIKHVPISQDPILFYREREAHTTRNDKAKENDIFTQVHNWGNDFSSWRGLKILFNTYCKNDDEMSCRTRTYISLFIIAAAIGLFLSGFFIGGLILTLIGIIPVLFNLGHQKIDDVWNEAIV